MHLRRGLEFALKFDMCLLLVVASEFVVGYCGTGRMENEGGGVLSWCNASRQIHFAI